MKSNPFGGSLPPGTSERDINGDEDSWVNCNCCNRPCDPDDIDEDTSLCDACMTIVDDDAAADEVPELNTPELTEAQKAQIALCRHFLNLDGWTQHDTVQGWLIECYKRQGEFNRSESALDMLRVAGLENVYL